MPARPFTPRDAALDLNRRMALIRQQVTGQASGHPLDIARAIRKLATARGSDPSERGPVEWFPSDGFSTSGPGYAASPPVRTMPPSPSGGFSSWLEGLAHRDSSGREHAPPLNLPNPPTAKDDGRYPMDERLPPFLKDLPRPAKADLPRGGWDERLGDPNELDKFLKRGRGVVSQPLPASDGGFSFPLPGATPPASPAGPFVYSPHLPPPSPGTSGPKPDSASNPGSGVSRGPSRIQVQLDVLPRSLRAELQKIAGAADRALREFRQVCAMTGTGRRR
jgi:hypothetical protein